MIGSPRRALAIHHDSQRLDLLAGAKEGFRGRELVGVKSPGLNWPHLAVADVPAIGPLLVRPASLVGGAHAPDGPVQDGVAEEVQRYGPAAYGVTLLRDSGIERAL